MKLTISKGAAKLGFLAMLIVPAVLIASFLMDAEPGVSAGGNATAAFSVRWTLLANDLTRMEYLVEVQNLNPSETRDFDLQAVIQETSFPTSSVNDMVIEEWKAMPTALPTYDVRTVAKTCSSFNAATGLNETYDCPYLETYQNGTEVKAVNAWKRTKMQLVVNPSKVSADYGLIAIPKLGSKEKTDDLGGVETVNGTKSFKLSFNVPIVATPGGWGSSGMVGIVDKTTGVLYHPWWSTSCPTRTNITYSGGSGLTDYPVNFSINMSLVGVNVTNARLVNSLNASVPFTTATPPLAGVPNTTFYHNYTDGEGPYQLYACSGIGQATYYNLSSFGNSPSTNWDYGTNGADVGGSGGGWVTSYCAAYFNNSGFYSGSTKGNMSVSFNAADCDVVNDFTPYAVAGKIQFRFNMSSETGPNLVFYTSEWEPTYKQHFRVEFGPLGVFVLHGGGTATVIPLGDVTAKESYLVEFTYNTSALKFAYVVSNSTWRSASGLLSDYQNTNNFFRRLFFNNLGLPSAGANVMIDDVWMRNYNITNNLTWSVGAVEYQTPPDTAPPVWNTTAGYFGSNTTSPAVNGSVSLFSMLKDETGLGYAWLETNESGAPSNKTAHYEYENTTSPCSQSDTIDSTYSTYQFAQNFTHNSSMIDQISIQQKAIYASGTSMALVVNVTNSLTSPTWSVQKTIPLTTLTNNTWEWARISGFAYNMTDGGNYFVLMKAVNVGANDAVKLCYGTDGTIYPKGTRWYNIGAGWVETANDYTIEVKMLPYVRNISSSANASVWANFTWSNSSIPAGTFVNWRVFFNDTAGNQNVTELRNFTVTSAAPSVWLNGLANGTYPYAFTPYCAASAGFVCNLWLNATNITAQNDTALTLGAGGYNVSANATGNATWGWVAVAQNATGTIKAWSLNDSYMSFNESVRLAASADLGDTVTAQLATSGGEANHTLAWNGSFYVFDFTKAQLGSASANATLVNVSRLYFGGSNYTQSSNATALQLDYARTLDIGAAGMFGAGPSPITNSPGSAVTIWGNYTNNEGLALSGSACSVAVFGGSYAMAYSAGLYEVTVSVVGRASDTYMYNISCLNSSYQAQACTSPAQTFIVTEGGVGIPPGGGGGGGAPPSANFSISPEEMTVITSPGASGLLAGFGKDYSFRVCSNELRDIGVGLEFAGDYATLLNMTGGRPDAAVVWSAPGTIGWVKIKPGECADLFVRFSIPKGMEYGTYVIPGRAYGVASSTEIPVKVTMSMTAAGAAWDYVKSLAAKLAYGVYIRSDCSQFTGGFCIEGEREVGIPYVGGMFMIFALYSFYAAIGRLKGIAGSEKVALLLTLALLAVLLVYMPV